MASRKIIGTETEYGITSAGDPNFDPISNSILLVNSYQPIKASRIMWDYDQESPLSDARGFEVDEEIEAPNQEDNLALNKILFNGARFYVDHAHPEFSTPECSNVRDALIYEKAGESIVEISRIRANMILPQHQKLIIYKNNSDRKGNSYGCHENYLMSRKTPFDKIAKQLTPFLVTRQIFTGAGKVGSENNAADVEYQISQRADFFETEIGLDTMAKRPIINTRDEPHADKDKYRRLHVISGDSNMSEYTLYLKLGVTSLVLQMIEDNFIYRDFTLRNPVKAMREVSHDITCKNRIDLHKSGKLTAIEIQREYFEMAMKYYQHVEQDPITTDILNKWDHVLTALEEEPEQLDREIDWVIKLNIIRNYIRSRDLDWDHPKVSMLDLQYHDTRPNKGLYNILKKQGAVERIVTDEEVVSATEAPPTDTRAYFRGKCQQKFEPHIFGINWDSISFNLDEGGIKRVLMNEPFKGSIEYVGELLEKSDTIHDLLRNLSS